MTTVHSRESESVQAPTGCTAHNTEAHTHVDFSTSAEPSLLHQASLFGCEHKEAHEPYEHVHDHRIIIHNDGDHPNIREVALCTPNHVFSIDPRLRDRKENVGET